MSAPAPSAHPRDRLARALRLPDAVLLVVSSVVGSGIFLTPGAIADRLPHPGVFLAAWVAGGLLSLGGALANAELAAAYPRAGGDYVYLREAFHPVAGFLVGWLSFFVIYAGTIAALAVGFADGLGALVPLGAGGSVALAVALITIASALNYVGVQVGAGANNLATGAKLVALIAFGVAAFAVGRGSLAHFHPLVEGASAVPARSFGLALSPVLFSYLGWNASIYVASEIRNPSRNVPRSLFLGLAACTALYLLLNGAYLYALPIDALRGTPNAGEAAATALFGPHGGAVVGVLVLLSILGTLNATILCGPRIVYAMALDGLFVRGSDTVHAVYRTPTLAIVLQAAASIALVLLLRSFPSALDYTVFAILLATLADVAALYVLRVRRPGLPRPYRAWGYPWVPALYLAANAAIAATMLVSRPWECGIGLLVLTSGLPFYAVFARRSRLARGEFLQ